MTPADWYGLLADVVDKFGPTAVGIAAVFVAYVTTTRQLTTQRELAEREFLLRESLDERRYKRRLFLDVSAAADDCVRLPDDDHKFALRRLLSEARLSLRGNDAARGYMQDLWVAIARLPLEPSSSVRKVVVGQVLGLTDIFAIELSDEDLTNERVLEIRRNRGLPLSREA